MGTSERIREIGLALGFARVGVVSVGDELPHRGFLTDWVSAGCCGAIDYLRRDPAARARPTTLLAGARSAVVVLAHYGEGAADQPPPRAAGLLARYARAPDYHAVMGRRLARLAEEAGLTGEPLLGAVDTRPLLERELAVAAGLGFIGKNTMLIAPGLGSFTCIGVLLATRELPPDPPRQTTGCGRCRLCVEACPTGALREPYLLDARRCISALTIEQRGPISEEMAGRLQPWFFGCDRCQEVCPHNARPRAGLDPELARHAPRWLELGQMLELTSAGYRRLVRGRALRRVPREVLARNAALLARGATDAGLCEALLRASGATDEGLRHAARWALG